MKVLNIHQREIPASAAAVGGLIDALTSEHDALWPADTWPAMRMDRPLGVAADGGHGPVRYAVAAFRGGQMVEFRFTGPTGFNGFHRFEVLPQDERRTLLRHTIDMKAEGPALLSWPLVFRPLHDALIEDALARAQAALGAAPDVRPWSPWVKLLRWALSAGKARRQQTPATVASHSAGMSTGRDDSAGA